MTSPRQRRGIALLVVAAVGAVGVFLAVSRYVAQVEEQLGPRVTALVLVRDVEAFTPVTEADVRAVPVPRLYLPATAVTEVTSLSGTVAGVTLRQGSYLQSDSLVVAPDIGPGQRAVSVALPRDAALGGGLRPYDVVDVVATYAGDDRVAPYAVVAVASARVLTVDVPPDGPDVVVTFAVAQPDAGRVALAVSSAASVRLTLLTPPGLEPQADRAERVTIP